jgi:hypothetical protein
VTVAWEKVRTALVAHLTSLGVVPPDHVFWEREAAPLAFEDVIELRIGREAAVGMDDLEPVMVAPDRWVPRITGWREFVLSIRFNSRSQATAARNALERIRASFHHPTRLAALSDAGVSFLSTETLQTFDAVADDRWESIGVLDVRMGVVSEFFEPDTDPGLEPLVDFAVNGTVFPLE